MCMMSAVTGYGIGVPAQQWNPVTWAQFKALLDRVDKLDKALGEPECIDPAKDAWLQKMSEMYDEAKKPAPTPAKKLNNVININKAATKS